MLSLTKEQQRLKLHEAIWKSSCSRTHRLWCSCGDWTSHIRKTCHTGEDDPITGEDPGIATDFALVLDTTDEAIAEATEEGTAGTEEP